MAANVGLAPNARTRRAYSLRSFLLTSLAVFIGAYALTVVGFGVAWDPNGAILLERPFGQAARIVGTGLYMSLPLAAAAFLVPHPVPGGELLVNVTGTLLASATTVHFGNAVPFSFGIPDDPSLCGLEAFSQGVVRGAPGYELSNALDPTVGL